MKLIKCIKQSKRDFGELMAEAVTGNYNRNYLSENEYRFVFDSELGNIMLEKLKIIDISDYEIYKMKSKEISENEIKRVFNLYKNGDLITHNGLFYIYVMDKTKYPNQLVSVLTHIDTFEKIIKKYIELKGW